jgi:hypothetical protein
VRWAAVIVVVVAAAVAVLVINGDDPEAYGRLTVPGQATLHLPSGEVGVTFQAKGNEALSLVLTGVEITADPVGFDAPPPSLHVDPGEVEETSDGKRRFFGTLTVVREGDYRLQATKGELTFQRPVLLFGERLAGAEPAALAAGALGAIALLLLAHDLLDELEHLRRADGAGVAGLEGLAPEAQAGVLDQLVEVRARDGDADLGVRRDVLGDAGARQLDAVELHVAAPPELELGDELEVLQGGHELLEVQDRLLDEGLGIGPAQILCLCRSFLPMTMRWISLVPSPMSSSGASRYRRSISYSLE